MSPSACKLFAGIDDPQGVGRATHSLAGIRGATDIAWLAVHQWPGPGRHRPRGPHPHLQADRCDNDGTSAQFARTRLHPRAPTRAVA